jgi:hypothetical protein
MRGTIGRVGSRGLVRLCSSGVLDLDVRKRFDDVVEAILSFLLSLNFSF